VSDVPGLRIGTFPAIVGVEDAETVIGVVWEIVNTSGDE
jgi:hypothetical protein